MKINFQMTGGFAHLPALSKPFIIDTAQLDPHVAEQLRFFMRESRFFDQPARVGTTAKGAADHRTYNITVEDDTNTHSIQLTDPITDADLYRLVSYLRTLSRPSTKG